MRIKRLGTLVTLGETRFSSNLSVDYVGQVTQGQWHKAKPNVNILFVSVRRSVTAKPWTNHYTKYGKYVVYTCLKTRYRKCEAILNKHALSFVKMCD